METTLEQATGVIRGAETQLRGLISQAAANAEYDTLPQLAEWAKQLGAMAAGPQPVPAATVPATLGRDGAAADHSSARETESSLTVPLKPVREAAPIPRTARGRNAGRVRKKGRRSSREAREYPKFLREGETLVKVGWSKKEKATYEHKAPRRVVTVLAEAITKTGRGGKRFSVENLLPLTDPDGGGEIPGYQAYLALAWLRTEELLTQHGRQGYSIPDGTNLPQLINTRWDELATR